MVLFVGGLFLEDIALVLGRWCCWGNRLYRWDSGSVVSSMLWKIHVEKK